MVLSYIIMYLTELNKIKFSYQQEFFGTGNVSDLFE